MNPKEDLSVSVRASLLRIYLGESDQVDHRPAFERVLEAAREHGLAGATVFRGASGFGANSVIHHGSLWRISQDLPILIEIVDHEAPIRSFLPVLRALLKGGGLVTLEPVEIVRYGASHPPPANAERASQ
ncbi:MAG: DUF190 domain-containing protein [Bryobacterales bacterium]|nr:DUF190 domain-containing protein [Bryobacterales bacterium]